MCMNEYRNKANESVIDFQIACTRKQSSWLRKITICNDFDGGYILQVCNIFTRISNSTCERETEILLRFEL